MTRRTRTGSAGEDELHRIEVRLDHLLLDRGMSLTELAAQMGVAYANLSVLKTGKARAIRFSTLTRLCEVLDCGPGDLLRYRGLPS